MGGGGWETWRHTHVHRDQEKCINAVKETETERGVQGRQRRRNELAQRQGGERKQRRATRTGRTEGRKDGRRCREEGKKGKGPKRDPHSGRRGRKGQRETREGDRSGVEDPSELERVGDREVVHADTPGATDAA